MGINCVPLIEDLFLYGYKSLFLAKLHIYSAKSDWIDKLYNSTDCYLHDIFAVSNPDLSKYVTTIYHRELTLNKAS